MFLMPRATSVLITPPTEEPLDLEQAKARAGLDWVSPDPRDALVREFVAAARSQVEQDTGLALLTQTRDAIFEAFPLTSLGTLVLPAQCRPVQSITNVTWTDASGVGMILPAEAYVVDAARGVLGLTAVGSWPAWSGLQSVAPVRVRVVAGWLSPAVFAAQAPLLLHAVGLLTAHYATAGRDLVNADGFEVTPLGYDAAIAPYVPAQVI